MMVLIKKFETYLPLFWTSVTAPATSTVIPTIRLDGGDSCPWSRFQLPRDSLSLCSGTRVFSGGALAALGALGTASSSKVCVQGAEHDVMPSWLSL